VVLPAYNRRHATGPGAPIWQAREVVRDLDGELHLLVRLQLSRVQLGHRELPPFMLVGGLPARLVFIDGNGRRAVGYFEQDPPDHGDIVFGYGTDVASILGEYRANDLVRLERDRLPEGVHLPRQVLRRATSHR
jgi:hypothetical protein